MIKFNGFNSVPILCSYRYNGCYRRFKHIFHDGVYYADDSRRCGIRRLREIRSVRNSVIQENVSMTEMLTKSSPFRCQGQLRMQWGVFITLFDELKAKIT